MNIEPYPLVEGGLTLHGLSKVTCACGASALMDGGGNFITLVEFAGRQLRHFQRSRDSYTRDCPGKQFAVRSVAIWEAILAKAKEAK